MSFLRNLFGKKESASAEGKTMTTKVAIDKQCKHEWVRVMEKLDNLTLKFSMKCKKCGATMPQ
jgi:hypothetical protein